MNMFLSWAFVVRVRLFCGAGDQKWQNPNRLSLPAAGSIGERAVPRQLEFNLDTGVGGRCRSLLEAELEAELDRMRRCACGEKRRQRCGEVTGRKQLRPA